MEKKIITFITIVIVFIGLPYLIYTIYIHHEDGIYQTLNEYASYTTIDKQYDVKVMNYRGVTGGEETYNFKFYIVDKANGDKPYFIKNISASSYGTNIDFSEEKTVAKYDVTAIVSSTKGKDMLVIDLNNKRIKGQKLRAFLF